METQHPQSEISNGEKNQPHLPRDILGDKNEGFMEVTFRFSPKAIALVLTVIALILAIVSWAVVAYEWSLGVDNNYWVAEASSLFNVTFEGNVPTWYTTLLFLVGALFSLLITGYALQNQSKWRFHWIGLTLLFLYLSLDEAAAVHEMFTTPTREAFNTTGYLYFSWMLVGIPAAIIVALVFLPFVLSLPQYTRIAFFLAGFVFLIGSVGVETIGAKIWYENGQLATPNYVAVGGVEEFLEMFGVILAIYGLLAYLQSTVGTITLYFGAKKEDSP
jgi:hypothetical protein